MGLTPNEIVNKEFNKKFRGYDTDQVNDYLDIIIADYEKMMEETHQLKQELEVAKEKNAYFAQLQESLNSSILVAQEAADRLKQNARKEAELILFEAEKEADRIVTMAVEKARTIVTETEALRRSSKTYRQRLENLIQSQLEIVSGDQYKNLFDEEIAPNLTPADYREASARASSHVEALEQVSNQAFEEAQSLIPEVNQQIFSEVAPAGENASALTEVTEPDQKAVGESQEQAPMDLEATQVFGDHSYSVEPKKKTESVLGQTIRIDLPASKD